jgi:FlaA1/EpsC-like NDP-sugar epimerase
LSGRIPDKDVMISIVGARPGEKLVEDIADDSEEFVPSAHPSISVSRPTPPNPGQLRRSLRELETLALHGQAEELSDRMKALAQGTSVRAPTAKERA